MQKINPFNNFGIPPSSPAKTGSIAPAQTNKYQNGELAHIKVLEHLGGGKLIIDLKGQRIVANTTLMLENGQEMDVIIRNIGDQIVLRLITAANQDPGSLIDIGVKMPMAEILSQIIESLENAKLSTQPKSDESLKQLLQKMKDSISDIQVDASKPDLADQIKNALEKMGYEYERKIADAIAKGQLQGEGNQFQLKAELLKLQSYLSEFQLENKIIQNELMTLIRKALDNIESQQIKYSLNSDNFHDYHFQIPIIMQDSVTTGEVEFFRRKLSNKNEDDEFGLILNFNLQLLGNMSFVIKFNGANIDCQVKVDNSETLTLVKEHLEEFRNSFTALGYDVNRIQCVEENHRSNVISSRNKLLDNIDIIV